MAGRTLLLFRPTDLRLHDNYVLARAIARGAPLLPLFCFDPRHFGSSRHGNPRQSSLRANFLIESVADLRANLKEKLGADLLVAIGEPEKIIPSLVRSSSAEHGGPVVVMTSLEPCSEETNSDKRIRKALKPMQGTLETVWQRTLYHPDDLPPKAKFEVMPDSFTPWRNHVEKVDTPVRSPLATPRANQSTEHATRPSSRHFIHILHSQHERAHPMCLHFFL